MNEAIANIQQRIAEIESKFNNINPPPETTKSGSSSFSARLQNSIHDGHMQQTIQANIEKSADKYNLDPRLIAAVIKAESGFNPGAVSSAGAQGLMQLMPATANALDVEDPFDVAQNIDGGSRYLSSLIGRYQDLPKALAAYNAGPGAVDKYHGIPPYRETQDYVRRIIKDLGNS